MSIAAIADRRPTIRLWSSPLTRPSAWLREPLLHFVVLGAAIFLAQHWATRAPRRIELSPAVVTGLRQDFYRRTGAQPTAVEEAALVQRYIDSEVLYREALALGLDRGDVIVRRRLEQKMEFVLENRNAPPDPTDAELQAFLEAHGERYPVPARFSFKHVFLSADRHAGAEEVLAIDLRRKLAAGADDAAIGDPFLHGASFSGRSPTEIASLFGESFARQLDALAVGIWSEPIRSSYGVHLVRIEARSAPGVAVLGSVRDRVVQDWEEDERVKARDRGLAELRQRYAVEREER
ncbi:MAG: peptidyl-prolyl cis-trans isomerase [Deltaproteobacteria bacterium]|nr:peptidyl-prolyl cis-trans isomerase [Deltaproteobacteria bacterium]